MTIKMSKCGVKLILTILLCFLASISAEKKEAKTKDKLFEKLVHTKNGPVQGVVKPSRNPDVEFVTFLGLRYVNATPRFEPAQPLEEVWTTPKVANTPGNICIQPGFGGNDDCLFLNVHVPSSILQSMDTPSQKQLPVMVWVPGGGFTVGEGHTYSPEYFMENENVILVTVNYRLGALGFITMENDSAFTANNGLRDLVMALKWTQQNIAAFGGDPNKVIVFGESAGSASVHYLLMSPLTKGLFHGAIMQSGAFSFWSYSEHPKKHAKLFAKALGCKEEDPAEIKKCLKKKPANKLMMAQSLFAPRWPGNNFVTRFLPTAKEPQENAFFSKPPSSFFTFHGGQTDYPNDVPVIIGVTRDEGSVLYTAFILALEDQFHQLNTDWNIVAPKTVMYDSFFPEHKHGGISAKIRERYFGKQPVSKTNLDPLIELYSDSLMLLPVMQAAEDMAKAGMKVWPYIFSYNGNISLFDQLGLPLIPDKVGHGYDLPFMFSHPMFGPPLEPNSKNEQFSKNFVKFLTGFAETGVPASNWGEDKHTELNWKPIDTNSDNSGSNTKPFSSFDILEINEEPKVVPSFSVADKLAFWRSTLRDALAKNKKQKTEL